MTLTLRPEAYREADLPQAPLPLPSNPDARGGEAAQVAIAEAMSAQALLAAARALIAPLGPQASVHVSASINGMHAAAIGITPEPDNHRDHNYFWGETWPDVFAQARRWIAVEAPARRVDLIRRMALAIIDVTDRRGFCTDSALRAAGFRLADIAAFGAVACTRAGEIVGGGPFVIVP